jgi:hypothetical protein
MGAQHRFMLTHSPRRCARDLERAEGEFFVLVALAIARTEPATERCCLLTRLASPSARAGCAVTVEKRLLNPARLAAAAGAQWHAYVL